LLGDHTELDARRRAVRARRGLVATTRKEWPRCNRSSVNELYELGPFIFDPQAGALTRSGAPTALGSRGVAVLAALLEHPSEYVSKSRIMDAAWPGLVVEESNLAVQISAIRRVLAQEPGGEHWIETLARRGYRFIGPVAKVTDDRPQSTRGASENTSLPQTLTSFIGRERELVEIRRLLPSKRLVTVVGAGGIGKTRLALQLAAEVMEGYRDGVWLVELGSINDPLLVPASVAQVLGVQEKSGTPLTHTLCRYLKARQLLLVLDNCEYLLEACAKLGDAVLRRAAQATILATSREPLHVAGEQAYSLQALSLPESVADVEGAMRACVPSSMIAFGEGRGPQRVGSSRSPSGSVRILTVSCGRRVAWYQRQRRRRCGRSVAAHQWARSGHERLFKAPIADLRLTPRR
jgi:DNA-binding winged helix-turn-helix (wHTH) protein